MKPPKKTKAFSYLRVSSRGQVEGDGFPRQHEVTTTFAAANDIKIVKEYREDVSGTVSDMDRPVWVEMVGAALANGVTTILVESLSRLARDLGVQEHILRDLKQRGITLLSASEPDLCSTDPTRVMVRQMLGAIHQYEKCMIVLKLRGARVRMKATTGRCEGAKPYGELAGEDITIGRMKALRVSGKGFDAIAATLNAEGVTPRRSGAKWHGFTVNKILTAQG